jgi:hypothetical protein
MTETKGSYNFGTTTKSDYHDQSLRCCMTCQHCDKDIHGEFSFHCYLDAPKFLNGTMYEYIAIQEVEWNGICNSYKAEAKFNSVEAK